MKVLCALSLLLLCVCSAIFANPSTAPIVTAEKYMEYKKKNGHFNEFIPPKIILVCYQQSTLQHLLDSNPDMKLSNSSTHLYLIEDGHVGFWRMGYGCSGFVYKNRRADCSWCYEIHCCWYSRKLDGQAPDRGIHHCSKSSCKDGVAHLYLNGKPYANADAKLFSIWNEFSKNHALPSFHAAGAWSFSAIFRETPADVIRVTKEGYDVVEMEAATLYAIGQEKGVQTLSLFVISDTLTDKTWIPHIKEPKVRNNLHKLSEWALEFCRNEVKMS